MDCNVREANSQRVIGGAFVEAATHSGYECGHSDRERVVGHKGIKTTMLYYDSWKATEAKFREGQESGTIGTCQAVITANRAATH